MPEHPPFPFTPAATEQRLLAAVVFTDASGYSARAEREEAAAVGLIEEDFVVMRELSKELGGTVLKSTGDGLLIYFTSAVQAVTWALRTQRIFAARSRTGGHGEVFRHRVGVHVGDVILREADVMGDGVNVAARVQTQAPPGGICISQTVYEVVKNKLELHVVRLEPRKLKNISELIQLYHVLLEEPQRPAPLPGEPAFGRPRGDAPLLRPVAPPPAKSRWPVGVALLLGVIGAGAVWMFKTKSQHEQELAQSQATQAALDAVLTQRKAAGAAPAPAATVAPVGEEFDFAKMATRVPASGSGDEKAARALSLAKERVAALDRWVQAQLPRFPRDRALAVRELRGAGLDRTVYTESDGRLCFVEGNATRKRAWESLAPDLQGAIIIGVLRAAPDRAARQGAEAFAYVHGLPEMAEALLRERSAETLFSR